MKLKERQLALALYELPSGMSFLLRLRSRDSCVKPLTPWGVLSVK